MRARGLALGFALGLLAAAPLVALAVFPAATYRAWARLRWGAVPSAGLVLQLSEAPADVAGPGPGPWVLATFVNVGDAPAPLCWSDPPGEELGFEVAPAGRPALPPRRGPDVATVASGTEVRRTWLPPGGRLALRCDLSRAVALPGPGVYEVRATRSSYGDPAGGFDGVRCASGALRLVVR